MTEEVTEEVSLLTAEKKRMSDKVYDLPKTGWSTDGTEHPEGYSPFPDSFKRQNLMKKIHIDAAARKRQVTTTDYYPGLDFEPPTSGKR